MQGNRIFKAEASGTGLDSTGRVAITLRINDAGNTKRALFAVKKLSIFRTAGTGATMTPAIVQADEAPNASVETAWQAGSSSNVSATLNEDFGGEGLYVLADASGKIYVVPGFDAGADNGCNVRLLLEAVHAPGMM